MNIQEMDLEIRYRSNSNDDALSRNPVPDIVGSSIISVAADFANKQYADPDYRVLIDYLNYLVMTGRLSMYYDLLDGILHIENLKFQG